MMTRKEKLSRLHEARRKLGPLTQTTRGLVQSTRSDANLDELARILQEVVGILIEVVGGTETSST